MPAPQIYRGTITREQWLLNETRAVARLRRERGLTDTKELVACVFEENTFQYPTERELKSIARACARRIDAITDDPQLRVRFEELLAHGTADQITQTNLYAMMCDNRVVWDFMTTVVARKFRTQDHVLRKPEIAAFTQGLRTQDERAATWGDATLNKIRQVLSAALEACGLYDRKTEQLSPLFLNFEVEAAIRANDDEAVLPAFGYLG